MELNQTSYVLLGLLSIEPNLSGYDMRKGIQNSVGYFWNESFGQIYPSLKRLAAEGLIEPAPTSSNGRKRRQEYTITAAGRVRLREWLALPFQNDPPRNEFLLKLFFGAEAAPEISIEHVRDLNARNRRTMATLNQIEQSIPESRKSNPRLPYWMLTLTLGRALTQAALAWGEEAVAMLEARQAAGTEAYRGKQEKTKKKASPSTAVPRGNRGTTATKARNVK